MACQFKKMDWILIGSAVLLAVVGLISIYSSSHGDFFNFKKQIIFLAISFFLMILFSSFNFKILKENPYLILFFYLLCLVLLFGLFFFAPEIKGARSWYKLGFLSFNPVEFAKIALIILLAKYFSMRHAEMYRFRHIIFSGFYLLIPCALVFFQPDLGSVLVLIAIWVAILFISGINLRNFLILSLIFVLLFAVFWSFLLKDYQKERVISFLLPNTQPLGSNWSQNQARIAIGSGGLFGQGIFNGPQTQYRFLVEPQTDFIFASIAEETGLVGIIFLFTLYGIMFWRIFKLAFDSKSNFPRLISIGFLAFLVSHLFINIGMNLDLMPVIGIPLPIVSYGGSGLISIFIGIGILQSIKIHQ